MSTSSQWPPEEAVSAASVIGRLWQLGYSPERYELLDYTQHHVLIMTGGTDLVLSLSDGHRVAEYTDTDSALAAFDVIVRRDDEEDEQ